MCKELVVECPRADGCPSCVGLANVLAPLHSDSDLGTGHSIPNKAATNFTLEKWLAKVGGPSDRPSVNAL